jgi:hypothetical protein
MELLEIANILFRSGVEHAIHYSVAKAVRKQSELQEFRECCDLRGGIVSVGVIHGGAWIRGIGYFWAVKPRRRPETAVSRAYRQALFRLQRDSENARKPRAFSLSPFAYLRMV